MPSEAAVEFILDRKALTEPASQRARIFATLSAEASMRASSAWRSVSCSPALTYTRDWLSAFSDG